MDNADGYIDGRSDKPEQGEDGEQVVLQLGDQAGGQRQYGEQQQPSENDSQRMHGRLPVKRAAGTLCACLGYVAGITG